MIDGIKILTDKGFTESRGDGRSEQEHGHDEGTHVLGRLGECVFQAGDGGEDFRKSNENVAVRLKERQKNELCWRKETDDPVCIQTLSGDTFSHVAAE